MTEENSQQEISSPPPRHQYGWIVATLILLISTMVSLAYLRDEQRQRHQLAAGYDQMRTTLDQTRSQLEAVTAKLNAATTAPAPAPAVPLEKAPEPKERRATARHAARKAAPAEDPRWKKIQAELENHQKQIAAAQEEVAKARADLEGNLRSTRDELGSSIARTHEELVALQKRGERDYTEFDLVKSKGFRRAGPLSISLRKSNRKRQYCDVKLIVDDMEIDKKHVNIFEPVLLYPSDFQAPVELVINRIDKDAAQGYVSTPKFRASELSAGTPTTTTELGSTTSSSASLEHRPPTAPQ
ncbi:MAG: hypothetical protein ACE145_10090 [Terriglobia bacterium]